MRPDYPGAASPPATWGGISPEPERFGSHKEDSRNHEILWPHRSSRQIPRECIAEVQLPSAIAPPKHDSHSSFWQLDRTARSSWLECCWQEVPGQVAQGY